MNDGGLKGRIEQRKAVLPNGCWQWTGRLDRDGYGCLKAGGRLWRAHRYAYEAYVGTIPDGMVLDHLCQNPACVFWGHLEPVLQSVNRARVPLKTHCKRGHPYDEANTYRRPDGNRDCIPCQRIREARRTPR